MELTNPIANALIRMVDSMAKEWPSIVSIEPGLEEKLRQAAMSAPTNSEEFLRFLLLSCQPFPEKLFAAALPAHLRERVSPLLELRLELRKTKEELVASGRIEQAAECCELQDRLTNEIKSQLAEQFVVVTTGCVMNTIEQLGWPADEA